MGKKPNKLSLKRQHPPSDDSAMIFSKDKKPRAKKRATFSIWKKQ